MELTKEYFDKMIAGLATKDDLVGLETRLIAHVDKKQDELAAMTQEGLKDMAERITALKETLDVREQVERHEQKLQQIMRELKLA